MITDFSRGWIAALETLRKDVEAAIDDGASHIETVYEFIDGYIAVAAEAAIAPASEGDGDTRRPAEHDG